MTQSQHPFRERPDLTLEQQVQHYREACARLMDYVWWHVKLTDAQREHYRQQGFKDIELDDL